MTIKERAKIVDKKLAELYPNPPIPLDHKDSYTLLVAVLLSAQCTDARVNKITPTLFASASDPLSMSKLSIDQINTIVRPCGLAPKKAQAIHGLSEILLNKHGGAGTQNFRRIRRITRCRAQNSFRCNGSVLRVPRFSSRYSYSSTSSKVEINQWEKCHSN